MEFLEKAFLVLLSELKKTGRNVTRLILAHFGTSAGIYAEINVPNNKVFKCYKWWGHRV